ncbi:TIGR03087 family PEP-CTERM/XrtA system glycosyltransferase [Roseomonas marmotae]|uniref:TIGR03087 family PEP-CTERM/XrtA system glycosyltransferase n=1 Tax=Roseomonas marmotae TaxID=2768161 RepID=A0ABS3KIF8_9PROT|nr:TIGR03087 family PEP-CTERM/XrtA system glycosyltransferase [Roseomonas marmotae]MBO1076787.1 TIGR03087 family PEP-CTERM/XrtA system glycosyltransferase [Roseomonas marmotae]QTI78686.1 TIGR03087 family PEP-CTERM/XrtA system glycosyltransferase [Roseomonas marmotae]
MRRLLFLCHRIPYPPVKGDKIRAWHMLEQLSRSWEVDLGCLVDDPADMEHLPALRSHCAEVRGEPTGPRWQAAARALLHCRPGAPLTLGWFHSPGLKAWVDQGLSANRYDAIFAYSAAMAPYVSGPAARRPGMRRVLDMVDVDSEKWRAYANDAHAPMRQVWSREARTLLSFERRAAVSFDRCLFVSRQEAARFAELAPETAPHLDWVENGVDMTVFDAGRSYPNPYTSDAPVAVFTGTMDYRPNVEAVSWFAREVMPRLRAMPGRAPEFFIVGASPAPAVRALAELPGVHVTGSVPDVRPYLAHASVAVAPLRIARGIQNKVLEAMALAKPVVASPDAFEGIHAQPGRDLLVGDGAAETARLVAEVLAGAHPGLGAAALRAVRAGHDWAATLRKLDTIMDPGAKPAPFGLSAVA